MRDVVGVMARAPVAGACKTRLAKEIGAVAAAQLYRAMIADVLAALDSRPWARKVLFAAPEHDGVVALGGFDWEVVPQRGADLGERLIHAERLLRAAPGDGVWILGSDAPVLPWDAVGSKGGETDSARRAWLGPTDDGGYYAIGLSHASNDVFRDIPWSTERVFATTRSQLEAEGFQVALLPPASDVDTGADLAALKAAVLANPALAPRCATWLATR